MYLYHFLSFARKVQGGATRGRTVLAANSNKGYYGYTNCSSLSKSPEVISPVVRKQALQGVRVISNVPPPSLCARAVRERIYRRVQMGCDSVSTFSVCVALKGQGRMQVLGDHSAERARFDVGGERQEVVLPKQRSTRGVRCMHTVTGTGRGTRSCPV